MVYTLLMSLYLLVSGDPSQLVTPRDMDLVACSESATVGRTVCSYRSSRYISFRRCGSCPSDTDALYFDRKEVLHDPSWSAINNNCKVRCEYEKEDFKEADCAKACNPNQSGLPLTDCGSDGPVLDCLYEGFANSPIRECNPTTDKVLAAKDHFFMGEDQYKQQRCRYFKIPG